MRECGRIRVSENLYSRIFYATKFRKGLQWINFLEIPYLKKLFRKYLKQLKSYLWRKLSLQWTFVKKTMSIFLYLWNRVCHEQPSEWYLELYQTSRMESFTERANSIQPLTFFEKNFILDVWQGFEYATWAYRDLLLHS